MNADQFHTSASAASCLSSQAVLDLLIGQPTAASRAQMDAHIDTCGECRQLVGQTAQAVIETGTQSGGACGGGRPLQVGDWLAERFEITRLLGRGGMGVVFQAWDSALDVSIAVKVLCPELATVPNVIQRLRREIVLARRIAHRHVCRLYDLGVADGHHFITMELVHGMTLAGHVANQPVDEGLITRWLTNIADALHSIHEAGVIHRDLKLSNCMVGADGRILVMDFGLAGDLRADQSLSAGFVGTPAYWSPEQARGEQATTRSDIYALGLIARDLAQACGVRATRRWAAFIDRCTAHEPAKRFQSAAEVRTALARINRSAISSWPTWVAGGAAALLMTACGLGLHAIQPEQTNTGYREPQTHVTRVAEVSPEEPKRDATGLTRPMPTSDHRPELASSERAPEVADQRRRPRRRSRTRATAPASAPRAPEPNQPRLWFFE